MDENDKLWASVEEAKRNQSTLARLVPWLYPEYHEMEAAKRNLEEAQEWYCRAVRKWNAILDEDEGN